MKTKAFKTLLFLPFVFLIFMGCKEKNISPTDEPQEVLCDFEEAGFPGTWLLENRSINGISNLANNCCEYLDFATGSQQEDCIGDFSSYGNSAETVDGIFFIDETASTIQFDFNDKQRVFSYSIANDSFTFSYLENGSNIEESWVRTE